MAMVSAQPATLCAQSAPKVPRFSVDYMDKTVDPGTDFYHYADGTWLKNNPVPPDKSRWAGFIELQERNWNLIHQILDDTGRVIQTISGTKGRRFLSRGAGHESPGRIHVQTT